MKIGENNLSNQSGRYEKSKGETSVFQSRSIFLKSATTPGSPLQPKRGPITVGEIHQKPASTLGSPLQPKMAGNPNQMESGDQISDGPRRTANLGPWQATISITCCIINIIVSAILFLVVFLFNGDAIVARLFPEYELLRILQTETTRVHPPTTTH